MSGGGAIHTPDTHMDVHMMMTKKTTAANPFVCAGGGGAGPDAYVCLPACLPACLCVPCRRVPEAARLQVEKGDKVLEIEGVVVKGKTVFDALDLITKEDRDDVRLTIQSHKDDTTRSVSQPAGQRGRSKSVVKAHLFGVCSDIAAPSACRVCVHAS